MAIDFLILMPSINKFLLASILRQSNRNTIDLIGIQCKGFKL
ncbi:hypothetical Protein YC6258_01668 [Gynuella sunshinyii YC6258]|uniref:Uncharacterized protein n=1 Tax=Gynuella sunshinyii YC6258 TaxID=1445510 RepID=A0A0C5VHI6_9GAMM|nr:hypothetical Protein YC6258_01668 [Gynuella sunshinyii YC6258]